MDPNDQTSPKKTKKWHWFLANNRPSDSPDHNEIDPKREIKREPPHSPGACESPRVNKQDGLIRKIYEISERKLQMEMCLRLADLIARGSMDISELKNPNLVDLLMFVENLNIGLFDEFCQDESNYIGIVLDLDKLVFGIRNLKLILREKGGEFKRTLESELEIRGYELFKSNRVVFVRHKCFSNQLRNEDPRKCYGVRRRQTLFGRQCYVGSLNISYESLIEFLGLMNQHGKVAEIRLDLEEGSHDTFKDHAFVVFRTQEGARAAIQNLHRAEFKERKLVFEYGIKGLRTRLVLENIPHQITKDALYRFLGECSIHGIRRIRVFKDSTSLVEFISSYYAKIALKLISERELKFDKRSITARSGDEFLNNELIFRKIPTEMDEKQLKRICEDYGVVTRVKRVRDHGYVEFESQVDAALAEDELDRLSFFGREIEVRIVKRSGSERPRFKDITNSRGFDQSSKRRYSDSDEDSEDFFKKRRY